MPAKRIVRAALITFLGLCSITASAAGTPAASQSTIDGERSLVSFTVTKLGYEDVEGRFTRFSGNFHHDAAHPENSSIRWRVQVASVKTDEPGRDRSLQAAEYFDAARYPHLSFESRRVRPLGGGRLEVTGQITIKGRTRPLTVIAEPTGAGTGFESQFELDRYDYGVVGGRVMGKLIGRTVRVHLVAQTQGETR